MSALHRLRFVALLAVLASLGSLAYAAASVATQTIPGLGTASFPTSTKSAEAQSAFLRGLLLLHLFEYSDASDAFIAAEKIDPRFAMAYWGEAMTYNHGVWNQLDSAAGSSTLAKFAPSPEARAARITDPREKAYMAAVELLYDGTGTKPQRDARYADAMLRLSKDFPSDDDARLFYALALIGKSQGVRDVPVYLQAADISKAVFEREPDNPGAAHYWIHGMDDPDHAAGALEAARALSKIAPTASHAQHMCSHIFMALGMWDDVVTSNVEAVRVDDDHDKAAGFPPYGCGHYAEWLEYGYFQQGRMRAAQQALDNCRQTDSATSSWIAAHTGQLPYRAKSASRLHTRLIAGYVTMRDIAVVESSDWNGPAVSSAIDSSAIGPEDTAWFSFVSALAAAERGDLAQAHALLPSVTSALDKLRAKPDADPEDLQALAVAADELTGLICAKENNFDAALVDLDRASAAYEKMAFAFGPPVTVKPPEELLGEVLLAKGRAGPARSAFEKSLKRAPRRTQSLLGLARAESSLGDKTAARETYSELLDLWRSADTDAPGLAEAKAAVAN